MMKNSNSNQFVHIGVRIKKLRIKHHLTQSQLAELAFTTPSHISNIERGRVLPGTELILSLSQTLNTSSSYLLDGTMQLNTDELELITRYREFPPTIQKSILSFINSI